jgi:anthranilate synthase component 1
LLSTFTVPEQTAGFGSGYIGYEAVEVIEPSVGQLQKHPSRAPLAVFMVPEEFISIEPSRESLTISVRASGDAQIRLQTIINLLTEGAAPNASSSGYELATSRPTNHLTTQDEYESMVRDARYAIDEGELIQAVVSQCVTRGTSARPIDIYQELTQLNPSPYMFFMDFDEFELIGSSSELMVRVTDRVAEIHPIVGTRPRGSTPDYDDASRRELLGSEKERAKHVMLVDLARNDLGAVCEPGTMKVSRMMRFEKYSHLQHLVSRVEGWFRHELDAIDTLKSCFPAGTLAGAPKIRAMQLIHELEPIGRGPYTGAAGWFSASGDMDTGTVIRSMIIRDCIAYVHGGGGVVRDSDFTAEYFESIHKMTAPLEAISLAEEFRRRNHDANATDSINSQPALIIE